MSAQLAEQYAPTILGAKRLRALDETDNMSAGQRACVHEYGLAIVSCLARYGIKRPEHIHDIVREIWAGAREVGAQSGGMKGGGDSRALHHLDWLLIQSGCSVSAKTLVRYLYNNNLVILGTEPSPPMIEASMDATNHMGVVTKRQKHTNRLRAAIREGIKHQWPSLVPGE